MVNKLKNEQTFYKVVFFKKYALWKSVRILHDQKFCIISCYVNYICCLSKNISTTNRDIGSLDNLHSSEISTSNSFLRRNHPKTSSIGNGSSNNISLGGGGNFNGKKGVTVFVRNIAYNINWNQLRERFHKLGFFFSLIR